MSDVSTISDPAGGSTGALPAAALGLLAALAEKSGKATTVPLPANAPLTLTGNVGAWLVTAGRVEIFAVPLVNGKPAGARVHIDEVSAGQMVFGDEPLGGPKPSGVTTHPDSNGNGSQQGSPGAIGLVAVGSPDTVVVRATGERLAQLAADLELGKAIAAQLDAWLSGLAAGVSRGRTPRLAVQIKPAKPPAAPYRFKEATDFSPAQGVLWVVSTGAALAFLGRPNVTVPAEARPFPLPNSGWMRSEGAFQLAAETTLDRLAAPEGWSAAGDFHQAIAACAELNTRDALREEEARARRRGRAERQRVQASLTRLAAVTSDGVDEGDEAEVDPLVAACRVIGARLDVTIQAPPASSRASIDDAVSAIGRASGVQVRRVLLKDGWQRQDNGPLLAFLSDDRPIALLPVGAAGYEIVIPGDPAPAQRVTPALAAGLQAHGYTFCRSLPVKKLTLADVFTFAMAGTQRDWATILALGLTGGLIGLAAPLAMGLIFSRIVPSGEYDQLLLVMFALFSAAVANSLFQFTQAIAAMRLETRMDSAVEMGVWDRLLNLPTVFHRQYEAGDLAMRAMGIGRIRQVISEAALSSVLTSVFSFISFGLLFYYSPFLALIATALFLVIVLATIPAVLAQLNYERKGQEVQGRVAGLMLQLVSGVSRIRGTGSEERALAAWARSFAQQSRLGFRAQSVANNLATFHAAIPTVSTLLVFAAVAVAPNAIASLPAFLAFNAAFAQVIGAAVSISGTFTSLLEVVPLYERAKPILETLPEFDPGKRWPGDLTGEIELSHVSFRYSEDGPLVLDDVSLHIRPGQFVAFVGASGAGKSTIFRLLLGFERPATGSVHYDRHDLAGLDLQATRRQIGVVLQNGRLVPGDIFTNIVGSAPLTLDDAWEAAKQSGLDADIRAMPMGMHTVLSEGESTLSGGQRQRLLIARAIVARPKILLFDEATSALDNVTQAKVSRSLESLKATRVVVAHRLSTVANADRIYVIERGKVVQQGRYQELMSVPGPFADLAKRQMV